MNSRDTARAKREAIVRKRDDAVRIALAELLDIAVDTTRLAEERAREQRS